MKYFSVVRLIPFLVILSHTTIAEETKTVSAVAPVIATKTPISQSEAIKTQASHWSLEVSEYQDYLELMEGPLGKWSPGIDPLMALGMFAQSEQKERRYAELYAQQEFALTERALRFQQAYRQAFSNLYPDTGMLDKKLLEPYFYHQQQKAASQDARSSLRQKIIEGDRLLVFVPLSCDQCSTLISQLMSLVSGVQNSGVDIYVRSLDEAAIRRWTQVHHIQSEWLDVERLTLNKNEGLLEKLQAQASSPVDKKIAVFLKRDDGFYQINLQDFAL